MIKSLLTLGLLSCVTFCWGSKIVCQMCNEGVTSPDQCTLFEYCHHKSCYYEARKGLNGQMYYYAGCGPLCYGDRKCCYSNFCNGRLLSELAKELSASRLSTTTKTEVAEMTTTQIPTPSFQLTTGGSCYVCSGETCGLPSNHYVMRCPDEFPYCMNTIQNDHLGNKLITKRCSSFNDCQVSKQLSAGYPNCSSFDAAEIYTSQFECSFCCETSFCNFNAVPTRRTVLMGK